MGILQGRTLQWVAMPSSRGSSQPRNGTEVSWIAGGFFTSWVTREAQINLDSILKSKDITLLTKVLIIKATVFLVVMYRYELFSHSVVSNSCDPMDCSIPGFPALHYLPVFAQTHIHWVGDAIQPSHSLSSPSPPAFNLSQHQSLFQWISSSHQVAKVLELQLQHQSFNEYSGLISFRIDWFDLLAVQGTLKSLL